MKRKYNPFSENDEKKKIMIKQRANLLKNLAETQKIIVDLETSYLDKESNLGIILRGWPDGSEKLVANDNDNSVQKLFSAGNRELEPKKEDKEGEEENGNDDDKSVADDT